MVWVNVKQMGECRINQEQGNNPDDLCFGCTACGLVSSDNSEVDCTCGGKPDYTTLEINCGLDNPPLEFVRGDKLNASL